MTLQINGREVPTNENGFLLNPANWSEDFAEKIADVDHIKLHVDHWELIYYFREFYEENLTHPTMHQLVMTLGKNIGDRFHDHKAWEKHIYSLFPTNPLNEICKLAGLPMPQPDD